MKNNKFTIDFNATDFIIDLRSINIPQKSANNRFKFVIIGLISLIFITASVFYVHAQVSADISGNISIPIRNNIIQSVANNVKMTATVPGWFKTAQTSNERLDIATNMEVFVNGQKVVPLSKIMKTANLDNALQF
ncbi:hypothetical protein L6270_02015 [Candidatus Parcubacteria bacterium]|nr:hypothetical protein [Patescibacteria group bacterium]MBU4309431.1 hypothetical protein [Patescibacteria group bacterium]MBU4431913.1 hypothetical protein [Patescibacteria group bacterium]MBU4577792.1 hypothetical protein [Patescibacteria group bacterium]MCG2696785.1 hypothetical protein [Candidatus Parcubacteria bacterium]